MGTCLKVKSVKLKTRDKQKNAGVSPRKRRHHSATVPKQLFDFSLPLRFAEAKRKFEKGCLETRVVLLYARTGPSSRSFSFNKFYDTLEQKIPKSREFIRNSTKLPLL